MEKKKKQNLGIFLGLVEDININKHEETAAAAAAAAVFSLIRLHYEWHHITLGWRAVIRERRCWFDELCMKGLLLTPPAFVSGKLVCFKLLRCVSL